LDSGEHIFSRVKRGNRQETVLGGGAALWFYTHGI